MGVFTQGENNTDIFRNFWDMHVWLPLDNFLYLLIRFGNTLGLINLLGSTITKYRVPIAQGNRTFSCMENTNNFKIWGKTGNAQGFYYLNIVIFFICIFTVRFQCFSNDDHLLACNKIRKSMTYILFSTYKVFWWLLWQW